MLLIGYLYGITSERKLVEGLRMHLAWRRVRGIQPSFRIIRGQQSDCAEPIFLISLVRLEIVFALDPQGHQAL